jgi:hypothetical protein
MKKTHKWLACIALFALVGASNAALYTQGFGTDPGLAEGAGGYTSAAYLSAVSHADVDPSVATTTYAPTGTYFKVGQGNVKTDGGLLDLLGSSAGAGRTVVGGVTIDTSGWAAGSHTISFRVDSFTNPNLVDGDYASFSLYEGSGVSGGAANYAVTYVNRNFDSALEFAVAGAAVAPTQIGASTGITNNGLYSIDFNLAEAGVAGDYIILSWLTTSSVNETFSTAYPGFTVDDIVIDVAGSAEFTFKLTPSDSLTLSADYPMTVATNHVVVDFVESATGVEITAITVSGVSNEFSSLSAGPITLLNPLPAFETLEFVFDATAVTNIDGATEGFNSTGSVDIVWTEIGSGVSNTNTIELIGDFNNRPTDFNYDNSLNMVLGSPATAVTNDISVSYVTGRPGHTNVQITAIDVVNATTNGFSVLTAPFTLTDPEPSNSVIQVAFDNSGGQLQNKESASADIVITWQEAGGTTNYVATTAVSVAYRNMPVGVIQQLFSSPTPVVTSISDTVPLNNFGAYTNQWTGSNVSQKTGDGYLTVGSGANNRMAMNLIEGGTRGMDNFTVQDTVVLSNGLYRYDFDFEMVTTPDAVNAFGFGAYALIGQDAYDSSNLVNYVGMDLGSGSLGFVEPETQGTANYRVHPNGRLIGSNHTARTTGSVYLNIQDGEDALFVIQSAGNAEPYVYDLTLTRVGDFDPNTDTPNSPNAVLAADFDDISAADAIVVWTATDTNADTDTNGVSIANTWRGKDVSWESQKLGSSSANGSARIVSTIIRRGTAGYDDVGVQDTIALTSGVYELTMDIDIDDTFPTNASAVRVEVYALSQDESGDVNQVRIKHTLAMGVGEYVVADGTAAFSLLGSKTYTATATETLTLSDMNVLNGQDVALVIYQAYGPDLTIDNVELVRTGDAVLTGYDGWAQLYPGFFDTALTSDPDGDGINNLLEYALNGDPTAGADDILPKSHTGVDGGSNYLYYVHTERTDDGTLTYTVEAGTGLVYTNWNVAGIEYVDESAAVESYKSVTNRTDVDVSVEFIRLQVEKD